MRALAIDRRIRAGGTLQQIHHVRQRVVARGAALPRLQTQRGGQPVITERSARSVLLAELTGCHRALGEAEPLRAILLDRIRSGFAGSRASTFFEVIARPTAKKIPCQFESRTRVSRINFGKGDARHIV